MSAASKRVAALLLATLIAPAGDAAAQTFGGDAYRTRSESPQNFALELRGGGYYPSLQPDGRMAYDQIFGQRNASAGPFIAFGGEFDWQILRLGPVASLGVGAQAWYGWVEARAPLQSSIMANPTMAELWERSVQTTSINAVPLSALAVLRVDGLARAVRWLPFVPYAKLGMSYAFWWVNSGNSTATTTGARPQAATGGSLGWNATLGVALMLDLFEPGLARQFDTTMGVNHSYLFFEGYMMNLQGFGGRPQLDVGTFTWSAGIALEF